MEQSPLTSYAEYVRSVLGVATVIRAPSAVGRASAVALFDESRIELRADAGSHWGFISVHDQWPVAPEARAVLVRLVGALKLTDQPRFEAIAAKPRSGAEARSLSETLGAGMRAAGVTQVVCFGPWALACAQNDPGIVARSEGPALGGIVSSDGAQLLLTHPLEALDAEPPLRKETWRHLQNPGFAGFPSVSG